MDYWKTDVTKRFTDFIEMSNEYSTSIGSIEELIRGIQNVTDSVSDGVVAICNQMERVGEEPEEKFSRNGTHVSNESDQLRQSAGAISSANTRKSKKCREIRDV